MRAWQNTFLILACSLVATTLGCCWHQGPYNNNPYGGSPYGAMPYGTPNYGAPAYGAPTYGPMQSAPYIAPGGTYVPGPATGQPTPADESVTPTWRPDGGGGNNAPPFNSGGNRVPTPIDDNADPLENFGPQPGANRTFPERNANGPTPAPFSGSQLGTGPGANVAAIDPFAPATPAIPARPVSNPSINSAVRSNPYDFDREQHSWIRGVVNFDESDRSWRVKYSESAQDPGQGAFTLAANPDLDRLQTGEVVYLEGKIAPGATDRLGRPIYDASRVMRLTQRK